MSRRGRRRQKRNGEGEKRKSRGSAVAEALEARLLLADVKPWTVMVYMDGDNNLEAALLEDFREMALVDNPDVNIVVQLDRAVDRLNVPGYTAAHGDWKTTMRFLVKKGVQPEPPQWH